MIIGSKLPAQIAANYSAPGSSPVRDGGGGGARRASGRNDEVSLSTAGRELYQILSTVRGLPDVREDRVAFLKGLIAEGKYSPNAISLAEKMVESGGL